MNKRRYSNRRRKNILRVFILLMTIIITVVMWRTIKIDVQVGELTLPKILQSEKSFADTSGEWNLILVNRNHYIPNNYQVELTELSNGKKVDSRIYPELQQMFNDARAVKEAKGIEDISDKFDTTVDIVTDAYIPAGYIANEFQKLDIYKRIAGIETEEEKDEMLEELIDRFGEPPKSVLSLLRVARLKALAHAVYITEIKQTGSLIKLTMFERAKINAEKIPELIAQYKSSLKFNMAENPYFTFDLKNGSVAKKRDVLDVVEELISQMRKELITAE